MHWYKQNFQKRKFKYFDILLINSWPPINSFGGEGDIFEKIFGVGLARGICWLGASTF